MYVIVRKDPDCYSFLSEVYFGSTRHPDSPMIHVACTWIPYPDPYSNLLDSDLIYFENRSEAYSLLVAMELCGEETCSCFVTFMEF